MATPEEELFSSRTVLRAIRFTLLSKGIRSEHDLEDGIHNVFVECVVHVRRTGRPPENVVQAIAIARTVAARSGIVEARNRSRRAKTNAGPTGDADAFSQAQPPVLDAVDRQRLLGTLNEALTEEEIETLIDLAANTPHAELAAEAHKTEEAMRKSAQRSREKALGAFAVRNYVLVGGFSALLGAGLLYVWTHREPDPGTVAHPRPTAQEHRRAAEDACAAGRWVECNAELDEAAKMDPGSERRVEVRALRGQAADSLAGTPPPGRTDAGAGDGGGDRGGGGDGGR